MDIQTYDVVVVGAGSTGENVADRAVRGGLSVAIVEAELVGGECSYWACIPSKALLRPIHALAAALRVPGSREAASGELDVAAVLAHRDAMVSRFDDSGQVSWLEGAGITLVRGHGRLAGEKFVEVERPGGTTALTARHAVVLATGTRAAVPPIPGLRDARPWTSREATSATKAPRRLLVLGGGVVAVEMAQAWRALGCRQVTMVERGDRLLGRNEPFAGALVQEGLEDAGVQVVLRTSVRRIDRPDPGGPITATLSDGRIVKADEVLVGLGRQPATTDLGVDTVGLEPGGSVPVDDTMAVQGVAGGWLYAVGDVNGRALLTHQGKYQARALGDLIAVRAGGHPEDTAPWGRHVATADHAAVPQVVFTDPEVASVGLTESQARAAGHPVRTVEYALGKVSGAALHAEGYVGHAKLVVDSDREVLLGATFVGQDSAELVHAATVALVGEVPISRLWHAVPSFPTISEVWLRLLEEWGR